MSEIRYFTDGEQATAATLNRPIQDLARIGTLLSETQLDKNASDIWSKEQISGFILNGVTNNTNTKGRGGLIAYGINVFSDTYRENTDLNKAPSVFMDMNTNWTSYSAGMPSEAIIKGYKIILKNSFEPYSESRIILNKPKDKNNFDFIFIEAWKEKISDTGFIFPYGSVQWKNKNTDAKTRIGTFNEVDFEGNETYCAFNKDNITDYPDMDPYMGWKVSELSEDDLKNIMSIPEHNCFYDNNQELWQVRWRFRVEEMDADTIQVNGSRYFRTHSTRIVKSFTNDDGIERFVTFQGKRWLPADDANLERAYVDSDSFYSPTPSSDFYGIYDMTKDAGIMRVYHNYDVTEGNIIGAIPVALVPKKNYGAYHPIFNPGGGGTYYKDGRKYSKEVFPEAINSRGDCLLYSDSSRVSVDGENHILIKSTGLDARVYLSRTRMGINRHASSTAYVLNNTKITDSGSMWRFSSIDSNGALIETKTFNTLSDSNNNYNYEGEVNKLIYDWIDALDDGTFVVVTTYDEPYSKTLIETDDSDMDKALRMIGGSRDVFRTVKYRGSFCLIGKKGMQEGEAYAQAASYHSGNDKSFCAIECYIKDGNVSAVQIMGPNYIGKYSDTIPFYGKGWDEYSTSSPVTSAREIISPDIIDLRIHALKIGV